MNPTLKVYLQTLKQYGLRNNIPNITPEVGQLLNMMIKLKQPKTILEIGSANGYSTIWMAEAAKVLGAKIHAVDFSAPTFSEAQKNLKEVGFSECVDFHFGAAQKLIPEMEKSLKFDFVFVDGQKAAYLDFWNLLQNRLNSKALIIFDDMLAFPEKTKHFSEAIKELEGFDQIMLPIDKDDGILVLLKNS